MHGCDSQFHPENMVCMHHCMDLCIGVLRIGVFGMQERSLATHHSDGNFELSRCVLCDSDNVFNDDHDTYVGADNERLSKGLLDHARSTGYSWGLYRI